MFCFKCGMKNEDNAKFCEGCGAPLAYREPAEQTSENVPLSERTSDTGSLDAYVDAANTQKLDTAEINREIKESSCNEGMIAPPVQNKRKKTHAAVIAAAAAAAVLVIAALVLFFVAKAQSDPSRIVKKYFQSIINHDYDTAYECMDISENEFTTKEMYIKAMTAEAEEEETNISDFTVEEVEDDQLLVKSYLVTYIERGSTEEQTRLVELVKQDAKQWLFFDVYKVAESTNMVTSCTINVPVGSTLYFDGIEVSEKYYEDMTEYMGPAVDSYVIDKMFDTMHEIIVEAPYGEAAEYEKYFTDGESVDFLSVELKSSVREELKKTADEFIRTLIKTATTDAAELDELEKYFARDAERAYVESLYEGLSGYALNDEGTGITDISITDLEITADESYTANSEVEVYLDFEFTFSGIEQDWFFDDVYEEYEINDPRDGTAEVYFVYENGKWKINDCYLSMSLYY